MTGAGAVRKEEVFLELGPFVRAAFLFYLFAYRIVFPLIHVLLHDGAKDLLALRFMAELLYTCLLAFPFIFYRREYGWLHPLVIPTFYAVGKAVLKNPFTLILPLDFPTVDFTVETSSFAAVLAMSNIDLAWTRLQLTSIMCLAQAVYLGFFLIGPRVRVPHIRIFRPVNLVPVSAIFIGFLVLVAALFILSRGGVSEVLVAMRGGRRALFAGYGHFQFAGTVAPMIAAVWFMYEKRPWRNLLFIAGLVGALVTALLVSGSRGAMIMPALTIILLWWKRRGRALILPTLGAAVLALIVIGAFGSVRQERQSATVDYSIFNPASYGAAIDYALADIEDRDAEETTLAVLAGANEKGHLWGRSYVNALTFWMPRAVWPDKPIGIDFYNMWINFAGNPIHSRPPIGGSWGIPVSAEMEAYWNFGIPGVMIVFALLGIFHATLARAAYVYDKVPLFWVVYVYTVVNVVGTSRSFVDLTRTMVVLVLFAFTVGILRFGASRRSGPTGTVQAG